MRAYDLINEFDPGEYNGRYRVFSGIHSTEPLASFADLDDAIDYIIDIRRDDPRTREQHWFIKDINGENVREYDPESIERYEQRRRDEKIRFLPPDEVNEMALGKYGQLGDFSKPGPFKDPDRKLVTHPVHIQKVGKFFERTPYTFNLWVSNLPRLRVHRESGETSPEKIRKFFGKDADRILQDTEDAITVIFLGNYGAARVMMTPWTMAHRIGHSVQVDSRYRNKYQDVSGITPWQRAEDHFFSGINTMLETLYGQPRPVSSYSSAVKWDWRPQYSALFNAIGTQRSSREGQIRRPYEFMYEMFAQYLKTGKITLNPLPVSLPYGRKAWGRSTRQMNLKPQYREEYTRGVATEKLAQYMERLFDSVLQHSVGKIYLM